MTQEQIDGTGPISILDKELDHLTGRDKSFLAGRWFSFRAALSGAVHTLSTQPNAWIELVALPFALFS